MSSVQATIRAIGAGADPASVCEHVNRSLAGQIPDGRFVTLVLATLDPHTRRVVYTNAGHNQPIHVRRDGTATRLDCGGPVLGVLPDAQFELGTLTLEPGDRLVFFTDGLVEATDGHEEFGEPRVVAFVQANRALTAGALVAAVIDEVKSFSGDARADDTTVVVLAVE